MQTHARAPTFVDFSTLSDVRATWYYSATWTGISPVYETGPILVAMVILLVAALGGILLSMRYVRKSAGNQGRVKDEQGQPDQNRLK
jgi:hypothetical protein